MVKEWTDRRVATTGVSGCSVSYERSQASLGCKLGFLGWLLIVLMAAATIYQIACPPIVGLNDNADFWRIMKSYGLSYPQDYKPDLVSFSRYYNWDGQLLRAKMFPSTELLPTGLAVAVSSVMSRDRRFDIVTLGIIQALFLLGGMVMVTLATTSWKTIQRAAFYLLLLFVFADVGYVSYFNSLYTESATLIFLVASLGILASILLRENTDRDLRWLMFSFFVATGLFVFAKVQNAPLGLVLAVFGYHVSRRIQSQDKGLRTRLRKQGKVLALTLALLSGLFWWGFKYVPGMHVNNVYNMVFNEIAQHSRNPVQDLGELGLDKSYMKYYGTFAWSPQVNEDLRRDVFKKVGDRRVVAFFVRHPARLWDLTQRCAKSTFVMRVPYLGNFEKSRIAHVRYDGAKLDHDVREYDNRGSDYPYRLPDAFRSQTFAYWSSFKEDHVPKAWWFLGICLIGNLAVIGTKRRWFDVSWQNRLITDAHLCLVACAVLQYGVAIIGEAERDIVKHLFLFNLLSDVCFIFIAAYAGAVLSGCRPVGFARKNACVVE